MPDVFRLAYVDLATPALEDGRIYLRSDSFLYCIGKR